MVAVTATLSTLFIQFKGPSMAPGWSTGVLAGDWTQSSEADFGMGIPEWVEVIPLGDGALRLSPASVRGLFTSTVGLAPFPFNALGVCWRAQVAPGTHLGVALRTRTPDGPWSNWRAVAEVERDAKGRSCAVGPLSAQAARAMQYRLLFQAETLGASPVLEEITLIAINSTAGPTATEARRSARPLTGVLHLGLSPPAVIPRAGWGADESLRSDDQGREIWPPEYHPVQKIIIHHTATENDDQDPVAWVQAIYYYHAVTKGWGDIGYNYLVDRFGNIYEGRYGGPDVIGGHALNYNTGSVGISAIGTYGSAPGSIVPPAPLLEGLTSLATWECARSLIHPEGHSFFVETDLPNIAGHRECLVDGQSRTVCPGDYLFAELPELRSEAWSRLEAGLPLYDARFLYHTTPLSMRVSQTYTVSLTLQNGGTLTWPAEGEAPVHLGYHWYDELGQQVVQPPEEDHRTPLEGDVPFGSQATLSSALVTAPQEPEAYRLEWDLVQEGVTWFAWQGSTPLSVSVTVSADPTPTPTPTATPTQPTATPTSSPIPTATPYPWGVYLLLSLRNYQGHVSTPTPSPTLTNTPTHTPTPTPTATPSTCVEGIANGGFEYDGGWEIPITEYPADYTAAIAHSGNRSMRTGIVEPSDNRYSYSSARQWVTIPADATSATLRFWLYPLSEEPQAELAFPDYPLAPTIEAASLSGDAQYVLIFDEREQWIGTLLWQLSDDRQWTFHQFDLMAYAGRTIKLHFGVYNDGLDGVTGMYVDDVSLQLCSPASPPR